jgi:hypothetical protein
MKGKTKKPVSSSDNKVARVYKDKNSKIKKALSFSVPKKTRLA